MSWLIIGRHVNRMALPRNSPEEALLQGVQIARVSTTPFFVLTQLGDQIFAIAESGATVMVVTSSGPELSKLKRNSSIELVALEMRRYIAPWHDFCSLLRLWWFFKKHHILIAHSTTPKAGLLNAIASFLAGVPIRIHTYTGQPWLGMIGIRGWIARRSDWLIGRLNTCCYADSASQQNFLISRLVAEQDRLHVLGAGSLSGVDLLRFDRKRFSDDERDSLRQSLQIPRDADVILFVGRIIADKGVRELLGAFERLKGRGSLAHLVLVGPFDVDSGAGGVIAQNEINSIGDVHVVGYSECPEKYMAVADILCLPSYREGFGTVVIEAGAMGLPTVASNIYGLTDAVLDGKTGILVPPRDVDSLWKALDSLLRNPALRAIMGAAARKRVCEQFDAEFVNELVIQEYSRHLKNKGLL